MNFRFDATILFLAVTAGAYYLGWFSFEWTVVLMLTMGLPGGGPA